MCIRDRASIETLLKVDLYGTAVLLAEVGKVIKENGVGVTIASQSGHRMPALTIEEDMLLATTPTEELHLPHRHAHPESVRRMTDKANSVPHPASSRISTSGCPQSS